MAEGNLDPANSDLKCHATSKENKPYQPSLDIHTFKSAAANIKINMAGMANKTILVMFILFPNS